MWQTSLAGYKAPAPRRVDIGSLRAQHETASLRHAAHAWQPEGEKDDDARPEGAGDVDLPGWPAEVVSWVRARRAGGSDSDNSDHDNSDDAPEEPATQQAGPAHHEDNPQEEESRTTIMVQRISPKSTEADVEAALARFGFAGAFDIVYLPLNRKRNASLGYTFVNFTSPLRAGECLRALANKALGDLTGHRPCRVAYSKMQGEEFLHHVAVSRACGGRKAIDATSSSRWKPPQAYGGECGKLFEHAAVGRPLVAPPPGLGLPHLGTTSAFPVVCPGAVACGAPMSL